MNILFKILVQIDNYENPSEEWLLVSAIAERTPYKALCPYVCMSVCMSQIFNHHKLKFYIVSVTYR